MADGGDKQSFELPQMAALAAAATTLITTISALAVGGALQQMQRNHGNVLVIAFGLVLAGAAALAIFMLTKPAPTVFPHAESSRTRRWRRTCELGAPLTTFLFLAGFVVGLWGMIITQQSQERPSMTASLDPQTLVLSGTATAHNLGTEGRMVTQIVGLTRMPSSSKLQQDVRYFAITGPNASGTATETFRYGFPRGRYVAVAASATTGNDMGCDLRKTPVQQQAGKGNFQQVAERNLPGCVVIYLPG